MPDSIILGIGLDLVEVKRMRASVRRSGERFSKRVFTPEEIAYCAGRARKFEHLAARFAAKEAALKALGTGITGWASMQEVEVVHDAAGRPEIRLSGGVLRRARSLGVTATHLSISHTEGTAAAMVVLEGRRRKRGRG
jgi:holo-[acyl-carrier protein] synthase